MARIRAALVAIAVLAAVASGGVLVQTVAAPAAGAAGAAPGDGRRRDRHRDLPPGDHVHRGLDHRDPGARARGRATGRLLVRGTGRRGVPAVRRRPRRRARTASAAPTATTGTGRTSGRRRARPRFTYSRAGAGSTQVHDGDVEGWKFGTGAAAGVRGAAAGHHRDDHRRARDHAAAAPRPTGGSGSSPVGGTRPGRPRCRRCSSTRRRWPRSSRAPRPPRSSAAERERRGRRAGRDRGGGQSGRADRSTAP